MLTATVMLQNVANQLPEIIRLATALSYVMGSYFIITSIAAMRNSAMVSSSGQNATSTWSVLKQLFVGAALLYLPSSVTVGTATLFTDTSPLSYLADSSQLKDLCDLVCNITLLIGVIAVIKGIYGLGYAQVSGDKPSPVAVNLTHVIGGIMLINLQTTLGMVFNTLGITFFLN